MINTILQFRVPPTRVIKRNLHLLRVFDELEQEMRRVADWVKDDSQPLRYGVIQHAQCDRVAKLSRQNLQST